ncbi:MAG TPA: LegC family aminotransferase, partial [Cytophagales bacterium]|nr:LegC family aminotransferase [Cytophagales bacterium]
MSDAGAKIVAFIREVYRTDAFVPLHAPIFKGNEKQYLSNCIDTTFVSYVGEYVNAFEQKIAAFTGAKYAVAVVNGTCALHIALLMADVKPEDEVITQALTFVATANAIAYTGATPTFVDVDKDTMGMSPEALNGFLQQHCTKKADGYTYNNRSGRRIKACVPMHTFGFPARIQQIKDICDAYQITLVEDSAESLGSYTEGQHTGLWGASSILSFNGNKTITCGGGGALITNDAALAQRAKHITTTAKVPHKWEFYHDALGYNYRLSNVHAAIGCAQMEQLPQILESKRKVAMQYAAFFKSLGI